MNDVAAWQECVDNSNAQLEHQALRFVMPVNYVFLIPVMTWILTSVASIMKGTASVPFPSLLSCLMDREWFRLRPVSETRVNKLCDKLSYMYMYRMAHKRDHVCLTLYMSRILYLS